MSGTAFRRRPDSDDDCSDDETEFSSSIAGSPADIALKKDDHSKKAYDPKETFEIFITFLDSISRNNVTLYSFSSLLDDETNEEIRSGSYKQTLKKRLPNGQVVAVQLSQPKHDETPENLLLDFRQEITLMSHRPLSQHQNIQSMLGLAIKDGTHATDSIGLVLEWAPYTLERFFRHRRAFSTLPILWHVKQNIIEDIAKGLCFLHIHGVLHGDLKEDNILVYTDETGNFTSAKVADFGLSAITAYRQGRRSALPETFKQFSERRLGKKKLGTERLLPGQLQRDVTKLRTWDVYCFGLLATFVLFDGITAETIFQEINDSKYSFEGAIQQNILRRILCSHLASVGVDVLGLPQQMVQRMSGLIEAILDSSISSPHQTMEYVFSLLEGNAQGVLTSNYKEQRYELVPFRADTFNPNARVSHAGILSLILKLPGALQHISLSIFEQYAMHSDNIPFEFQRLFCEISYALICRSNRNSCVWQVAAPLFSLLSHDPAQHYDSFAAEMADALERIKRDKISLLSLKDRPFQKQILKLQKPNSKMIEEQWGDIQSYHEAIDASFRASIKPGGYPIHILFSLPVPDTYRAIVLPPLVEKGFDLNQLRREPGQSHELAPLHLAVFSNDLAAVDRLLLYPQCQADALGYFQPGMKDTYSMEITALVLATQHVPDVHFPSRTGPAPRIDKTMYEYLAQGKRAMLQALLKRGADSLFRCGGMTPLHRAVQVGSQIAVDILLEHDPKVIHCLDFDLNTPLHSAIESLQTSVAAYILTHMKSKSVNVNSLNNRLETPLDTFRSMRRIAKTEMIKEEFENFVQLETVLVDAGCVSNKLWVIYDRGSIGKDYIQLDSRWQHPHDYSVGRWCSLLQHDQMMPAWMWEIRHTKSCNRKVSQNSIKDSAPSAAPCCHKFGVLLEKEDPWSAGVFALKAPAGSYRLLVELGLVGKVPPAPFGIKLAVVDLHIEDLEFGYRNTDLAQDAYYAAFPSTTVLKEDTIRTVRGSPFVLDKETYIGVRVSSCVDWNVESPSWMEFQDASVLTMASYKDRQGIIAQFPKLSLMSATGLTISRFCLEHVDENLSDPLEKRERVQIGTVFDRVSGSLDGRNFVDIMGETVLELEDSLDLYARQVLRLP